MYSQKRYSIKVKGFHISKKEFNTVFITGASSGLGLSLAQILISKKRVLHLFSRSEPPLLPLLKTQGNVLWHPVDLLSFEGIETVKKWIQKEGPDLLINNAGFGTYGTTLEIGEEKNLQIFDLNGRVPFILTQAAAQEMKKRKLFGVIYNVGSFVSTFPGFPYFTAYHASKKLLYSFSLSMDAELKKEGIRILVGLPGQFRSHFHQIASHGSFEPHSFCMSAEKGALYVIKQIERRKNAFIFNPFYRLLSIISKGIPKPLLFLILEKVLKTRF